MTEDKVAGEIARFQDLAKKILIPMDIVINRLHRRQNARSIYFALADSRERLIQFLNIKRIDEFVAINLQMNFTLNKITKLDQDSPFPEEESVRLIMMVSDWRSKVYNAVREMTLHPEG